MCSTPSAARPTDPGRVSQVAQSMKVTPLPSVEE
ncbi:Uncharacterised protein [Mycobacteroides abscessus subsp. abscessus]|nr:Uncharacterised protein [Mycobacteroides abscessus subsp. abscessus]